MRTIAIINQKGGCGKTTVSINLAAVLAVKGFRTLLVDMDPQSHCALGLAVPEDQIERSLADLLRCGLDGSLSMDEVTWQISRHFDLAPSTLAMAAIEPVLAQAPDKDRRLAQILATVDERYDYCIIDCPPSIGLLTFNALRASDEIIIPVETGYFSMQGSIKQQRTIEMLAERAGHHARFAILATMYDVRTKLAREILSEIKRHFGEHMLPAVINFNSKLKEAASFGQPITEYDPASRGMQDFEQLADWLVSHPPTPAVTAQHRAGGGSATPAANPALSRAAELVERARALSARTAQLSAKLSGHGDPDEVIDSPRPPQPVREPPAEPSVTLAEAVPPRQSAGSSSPANGRHGPLNGGVATATARSMVVVEAAADGAEAASQRAEGSAAAARAADNGRDATTEPVKAAINTRAVEKLYGVRKTSQGLLFVQPINGADSVAVAADFNNWQPETAAMHRDDRLGVWQVCVNVPPGKYRYRLVIDGSWECDRYNDRVELNPFGELNNIVEVAEATPPAG